MAKLQMDKKAVLVIFSGGQDSTTCLFWAMDQFTSVYTIGFDYGQRHRTELKAAEKIADLAKVSYNLIELDTLSGLSKNALTNKEIEIKASETGDPPNTLVEGRNLLFLTYAAIYAKKKGIHNLVMGVSQTDYSGYPDCRNEFIQSAANTLSLAFDFNFNIYTPLMYKDKAETWALADNLNVLELVKQETVTCYRGIKGSGCGTCPACLLRERGLQEYLDIKK